MPRFAAMLRALGALLVLAGALTSYTSRALFNGDAFADRLAASLADDRVAGFAAGQITDAVIAQRPDLTAVRPVLLGLVQAVVRTEAFRAVARRGARAAHQSLLEGSAGQLVVSLPDFETILRSALATSPEIAERIPEKLSAAVTRLSNLPLDRRAASLMRFARASRRVALLVLGAGVVLTVSGIVLARRRRRALLEVGETWVGLAVVIILFEILGGFVVRALIADPGLGDPAVGLWRAFMGGLRPRAYGLALVGLACAAAVSTLEGLPSPRDLLDRLGHTIARPPGGPAGRLVRAFVLLGLGFAGMLWPRFAASTLAVAFAALLAFLALREVFSLALPAPGADPGVSLEGMAGRTALRVGLTAALVVAVVATGYLYLTRGRTALMQVVAGCNGDPRLCDRRLDDVVFPGTHNSMAAAEVPGWFMPNQESGVEAQLAGGVRAFLIDIVPGIQVGDRVRTELADESAARATYNRALGPEGVDAALRIRDRLVPGEGDRRGLFLCHGFCELGSLPVESVLETFRTFLTHHPGEVLLVIVQDEGVTLAELAAAVEAAGLRDVVYPGPFAAPWPTLGELVSRNQRLLLFVEHAQGGPAWLPNAYDVFQETPFQFSTPESMTCARNRGGRANSLFLVNHFIESVPPRPTAAAPVNTLEFLERRARRCQRERRRVPNIIAVDFWETGDVVGAARALNGLD